MGEDAAAIERAVRLHSEALAALEDEALDRAAELATESLHVFERESGPSHPDLANVLNCLARVEERRARYKEAEAYARRSAEMMRDVPLESTSQDLDRLHVHSLVAHGDMLRILG